MASIAPSRLAALVKTRCTVFQTSYNPTSVRTGAKYLRARLRGPSMMNYYPPTLSLSSIIRQFPEMELVDAAEQQRLQDVEDRKKRGKGTPKKAKSKGLSLRSVFTDLLPDLSCALFVCQPTADVHRGNGRHNVRVIFTGRLLEDPISNLEYINWTSRPTLPSISAWSFTVDPVAPHSPFPLFPPQSLAPPSDASRSLCFPCDRKANPRPLHPYHQWLFH